MEESYNSEIGYAATNLDVDLQAHRGVKGDGVPENTPYASWKAAKTGLYNSIEKDIRWTKDGVPVFFHDVKVDDKTDGSGELSEYTWDELQKLNLVHDGEVYDGGITHLYEGLDEIAEIIHGDYSINEFVAEIKEPGSNEDDEAIGYIGRYQEVMDALEARNLENNTRIHSFNSEVLEIFAGDYPISLAVDEPNEIFEISESIEDDLHLVALPYQEGTKDKYVREIQQRGIKAEAWNIQAEEDLVAVIEMGFDSACVDLPEHIENAWKLKGSAD